MFDLEFYSFCVRQTFILVTFSHFISLKEMRNLFSIWVDHHLHPDVTFQRKKMVKRFKYLFTIIIYLFHQGCISRPFFYLQLHSFCFQIFNHPILWTVSNWLTFKIIFTTTYVCFKRDLKVFFLTKKAIKVCNIFKVTFFCLLQKSDIL